MRGGIEVKVYRKVLSITTLAFLILTGIIGVFMPDKKASEMENRILTQKPIFTWKDLKSGKFTSKYEEYITDQFPFRYFWVSVKSNTERILQKKDNKNVYLGKEGYLLQKPEALDKELISKNIDAINKFADDNRDLKTYFLLAPNSMEILKDKLPPFATTYDQYSVINDIKNSLKLNVNFVDIYDNFNQHKEEYIYYKTDHHWTSLGAYYAYNKLGSVMEYNPLAIKDFNVEKATDEFYGTLYSRGNFTFIKPDSIHLFKSKANASVKVEYLDDGKESNSLYEPKHLKTKDKYSVFLDGNHALTTIKTDLNNGKKLLVLKDSYAHSLVPFLTNHYEEIHMIDLRYFNMPVQQYMKEYDIKEVLLLYNFLSFTEDNSVIKLKVR